jgi:ribosome-associated protein
VTATPEAVALAQAAAAAAADKLADDVRAFDVSEHLAITDIFVLASAANDRQVKSIVDEVERQLLALGAKPARREGDRDAHWVLLDYIDVVVHIFTTTARAFYRLETLWGDVPRLDVSGEG